MIGILLALSILANLFGGPVATASGSGEGPSDCVARECGVWGQ